MEETIESLEKKREHLREHLYKDLREVSDLRRGMDWANEVCVIGDGAPWIWNIADEQFYGATQIVDLYHAREHYWNVAKACFGQNNARLHQWTEERCSIIINRWEDFWEHRVAA